MEGNGYQLEALMQLWAMLTENDYNWKMVVIPVGYEEEMHRMLETYLGLGSSFELILSVDNWSPSQCALFLNREKEPLLPFEFKDGNNCRDMLERAFEKLTQRSG